MGAQHSAPAAAQNPAAQNPAAELALAPLSDLLSHDAGARLAPWLSLRTLHRLRAVSHIAREYAERVLSRMPRPVVIGGREAGSMMHFDPTRLRWCSGGLDGSALARKSMDNVSATMLPGGRIVTLTEIPYVPGKRTTRVSDPCADHYAVEVRAPAGPAGAWSTLFGTEYWRSQGGAAVALPDDRTVLLMGGARYEPTTDDEFMEPSVLRVDADGELPAEELSPMRQGRASFAAGLLNDGRVIVAGGWGNDADAIRRGAPNPDLKLDHCEIYSPASDSWTEAAPMKHGRTHAAGCVTRTGLFVVVGGRAQAHANNGWAVGSQPPPEVFDPEQNAWSMFPSPSGRR